MGDPTEPGEEQQTTIIIEGPPKDADQRTIDAYAVQFEEFKKEMRDIFGRYRKVFKIRLKKIEYLKKENR